MNEPPVPERVRVTGPPRRQLPGPPPGTRLGQIDAETRVGEIYMRSLLREQLRLAAAVLLLLALGLGSLPLAFHVAPHLASMRLLGVPLAWLLIAVLAYPYLFLLGWWYVRAAERNERDFVELVESAEGPP